MKCGNKDCNNEVLDYRKSGELKKHCSILCQHKSRADTLRKNIPDGPAPFCECGNKIPKFKGIIWNTYCSTKCANAARSIDPGPAPHCSNPVCDTIITKKKNSRWLKYCSPSCRHIGVPAQVKLTCLERYGVTNGSKSEIVKDRIKEAFTEKYGEGITNAMHLQEFRNKIRETNIEKYGTYKPQLLEEIEGKSKQTCIEKYGVEKPQRLDSIKQKTKTTNLRNYGVEHSSKLKETQNKKIKTNVEKYGVTNVMHDSAIFERTIKRLYHLKEFIFPSGNIIKVRGYEPFALSLLLNVYDEVDFITKARDMPELFYVDKDKKHRYYPDIYIHKDNLIIEVKSQYTYNGFVGWYNTNLLKRQACIDAGYNFKFMIFDKTGNLLEEII